MSQACSAGEADSLHCKSKIAPGFSSVTHVTVLGSTFTLVIIHFKKHITNRRKVIKITPGTVPYTWYHVICTIGYRGHRGVLVIYLLNNLIQRWKFLAAPLGNTVARTASMFLHPRPLRACAEPQVGVISPRRSPLVCNTEHN